MLNDAEQSELEKADSLQFDAAKWSAKVSVQSNQWTAIYLHFAWKMADRYNAHCLYKEMITCISVGTCEHYGRDFQTIVHLIARDTCTCMCGLKRF